jgi:hypothetical protein
MTLGTVSQTICLPAASRLARYSEDLEPDLHDTEPDLIEPEYDNAAFVEALMAFGEAGEEP